MCGLLCDVAHALGHDMRESQSRVFGKPRVTFEEDLAAGSPHAGGCSEEGTVALKHPRSLKPILVLQCFPASLTLPSLPRSPLFLWLGWNPSRP